MPSRAGRADGPGTPDRGARTADAAAAAPARDEGGAGSWGDPTAPADELATVAITGSATFVGRSLVALLESAPNVGRILSVDVTAPRTRGPKTSHFSIDLAHGTAESRLAELFADERPTSVAHAAFAVSPGQDAVAEEGDPSNN